MGYSDIMTREDYKRFWSKVTRLEDGNGCWEFKTLDKKGYGQFNVRHTVLKAHRISWEFYYGPIKKGMNICHHCDNPKCVRPTHLFEGTHKDNSEDCKRKGRFMVGVMKKESTKLSFDAADDIRKLYESGVLQKDIAKKYGVARCHISDVVNGKRWGANNYIQKGEVVKIQEG